MPGEARQSAPVEGHVAKNDILRFVPAAHEVNAQQRQISECQDIVHFVPLCLTHEDGGPQRVADIAARRCG